MEKVILVNKKDEPIGVEEKLKVHCQGKLHRAFSIFIFNAKGQLFLQKRSKNKHHSPGLWSNSCCSHPRPNKDLKAEAERRLKEELGIESNLREIFSFIYKAKSGRFIEYEFDHVFIGEFNGQPKINKKEIDDFKWIGLKELKKDIKKHPQNYTFWLKKILNSYGHKFRVLS